MELTREVLQALGQPFPDDEVDFLPRGGGNSGKALALPYADARSVMNRLDSVVGPGNWSFDYDLLCPNGKMVKGRLTVCGVTKCDAGEAGPEDEPLKSAVSDALKRSAVHFNIGRYLYYLPQTWAPYDSQKRRFTERPQLNPAAVRHALKLCGVELAPGKPGQPAPQPARQPAPAPVPEPRENGKAQDENENIRLIRSECLGIYQSLGGDPKDAEATRAAFAVKLGRTPDDWKALKTPDWIRIRAGLQKQVAEEKGGGFSGQSALGTL
jgi:hypothetical protein